MIWLQRAVFFVVGFAAGFVVLLALIIIYWPTEIDEIPPIAPVAQNQNTPVPVMTSIPPTQEPITISTSTPTMTLTPLPLLPTSTPTPLPTWTPAALPTQGYSAPDVIHAFRMAGLPIGEVIEYTADTDINQLLGRPNQYIAKITWRDTRIESQGEPDISTGGTIEVFLTVEDLQARKGYVDAISKSASMFAEYSYDYGTILLRLSHDLTPDEAKGYENVLKGLPPRD